MRRFILTEKMMNKIRIGKFDYFGCLHVTENGVTIQLLREEITVTLSVTRNLENGTQK
jgi:hypothetical protein